MDMLEEKPKTNIIETKREKTQKINFQRVVFIIGVISLVPVIELCWLVGNGCFLFIDLTSKSISWFVIKLDIENNARNVLSLLEIKSNGIMQNLLG